MPLKVKFIQALHGDSILITNETENGTSRILIDGGPSFAFSPRPRRNSSDGKLKSPIAPSLFFSAAQLNVLSLSIFLARALHVKYKGTPVQAILIDDPIHSMDSINILSTIDLLRNISVRFDRQIILSTHDENFHELLKMKIPSEKYASKFMKLESFGKVA